MGERGGGVKYLVAVHAKAKLKTMSSPFRQQASKYLLGNAQLQISKETAPVGFRKSSSESSVV
jgi:hypothetical protein